MKERVCRLQYANTNLFVGASFIIVEIQARMQEIKLFVSVLRMTLPLFLISLRGLFKLISLFAIFRLVLELFLIFSSNQFSYSYFLYSSLLACFLVLTHMYLTFNSVSKRQSLPQ